ncbi:MAG: SMC-Scp complex subunit ScpB [Candidatus Yonathbacteria bacterium]|nr:SMC-Scp complex subunit ScpB [Candidatus Yonathbacteria bacterium]
MSIDAKLEAILFFKAEPLSIKKLTQILKVDEPEVKSALATLKEKLTGRGVTLIEKDDEVMLGTAPEASGIIEELSKEELSRDLGKAGLETLSIVLYCGPITRSGIDYIRGVNSTFILRNLLIRGLVEKIPNPTDQRSFLYRATFDLLAHLGIPRVEDLPEYGSTNESIEKFVEEFSNESNGEQPAQ